jgi:hypothetical protein
LADLLLVFKLGSDEACGVSFEGYASPHDFCSCFAVWYAFDFNRKCEAVQQLGSEFAFFRVHGADEDEL